MSRIILFLLFAFFLLTSCAENITGAVIFKEQKIEFSTISYELNRILKGEVEIKSFKKDKSFSTYAANIIAWISGSDIRVDFYRLNFRIDSKHDVECRVYFFDDTSTSTLSGCESDTAKFRKNYMLNNETLGIKLNKKYDTKSQY